MNSSVPANLPDSQDFNFSAGSTGSGAEDYVNEASRLLGLPLQAEHYPGVVDNVERIHTIVQQVMAFPLPETIEVAPVFQP